MFFYVLFNIIFANIILLICLFSQIDIGFNYKVCNLFFFPLELVFFPFKHMKSYTACLVGCTRILVGIWSAHDIIIELFLMYITIVTLHVLFLVLLRSVFLLKRMQRISSTFFIPISHVRYIYGKNNSFGLSSIHGIKSEPVSELVLVMAGTRTFCFL